MRFVTRIGYLTKDSAKYTSQSNRIFNEIGTYQTGQSFVYYLINLYGKEMFIDMFQSPSNFETIYGKSISKMVEEWKNYLGLQHVSLDDIEPDKFMWWHIHGVFGVGNIGQVEGIKNQNDLFDFLNYLFYKRTEYDYERILMTQPTKLEEVTGHSFFELVAEWRQTYNK